MKFAEQHKSIPYKYLVYSKHAIEPDDVYEFLYDVPCADSVPNRCLKISRSKVFKNGMLSRNTVNSHV